MKRFLYAAALIAAFLPLRFALATEVIRDFTVRATLQADRTFTVTESITYDFGDEERHGIYRFIPEYFTRNGARRRLPLTVVDVLRDGRPEPYEISHPSGMMNVKIGDPDVTIRGVHRYDVTYRTDRVVSFGDERDELYWNVTGDRWPVSIERVEFRVALPEAAAGMVLEVECFTGPVGSTEVACEGAQQGASADFRTTRLLHADEGFTVLLGLPKEMITPPSSVERFWMTVADNGLLTLPLLALIIMLVRWWRKGRDPERGTVVPIYEAPHGLTPAEVAALMLDGSMPRRAVTATLLDLARRGYFHIRSDEEKKLFGKKYHFTFLKRKEADAYLEEHERVLFEGLFVDGDEAKLEDLAEKHQYHTEVGKARQAIWKRLASRGLFDKQPALVRALYLGIGILAAMLIGLVFHAFPYGWLAALGTAAVIMVVGWYMPRCTPKGAKLMAEIKGFEWFLSVAERERLDFHNAPERTPQEFHALLPYAVALQVEKKWAKQFEDMTLPKPDWAEGSGWSSMSSTGFAMQMGTLSNMTAAMGSPPGSSGGGSSGGGGGGGGGGSW